MKSFHFDLGDSTDGPIGYCARIEAETAEEAVAKLNTLLADVEVWSNGAEYIAVYFNWNGQYPTINDINEVEELA